MILLSPRLRVRKSARRQQDGLKQYRLHKSTRK
nr:MAG TPA: hypothetical protein [Caudoviricetes sp.]